jgi:hypothetical protein
LPEDFDSTMKAIFAIMLKQLFFSLAIVAALLTSCGEKETECVFDPKGSVDSIQLNFVSLEDSLTSFQSKQQFVDFLSRHAALRDIFLNRQGYPDDSAFINRWYKRYTHPGFDTLLMETKKVFGNDEELKNEFRLAFANLKHYYPSFQIPRIETVITGLESDLFVSDSLIIIGLDYYLGKKAKYRPDMHQYMLRRYEKNFIVPSALLLIGIDTRYNKTNLSDRTILADMITYGKAYYFAKHMMPCTPDSVFIGYTGEEIIRARANQDLIWKRLVDDEVFFSTSQKMKQRYVAERPKTYEIGDECPGRIATWVGWQIVNAYAKEHSGETLPQIMAREDAGKILRGSKYKPMN